MAHLTRLVPAFVPALFPTLFLVAAAGCGEPLLDDDYRGVPVWKLDGELSRGGAGAGDMTDLRLALFWNGPTDNVDPEKFVDDLARVLTEVVTDPERAAAYGKAGRERAANDFSWSAIADATRALYEEVSGAAR